MVRNGNQQDLRHKGASVGGAGRCFVRSGAGTVFIRSAVTEVVASAIRLTPVTGTTRNKAPEATGRVYPVEALHHRTAGPGTLPTRGLSLHGQL